MSAKADDASRIAGLASILQSSNKQKEAPPSPPPASTTVIQAPVRTSAKQNKQERVGKKSDPNFHLYGVFLRKATQKKARRRWEDTQPDKDFSDLMQELLEQWLTKQ
jgi:hypothetical protein